MSDFFETNKPMGRLAYFGYSMLVQLLAVISMLFSSMTNEFGEPVGMALLASFIFLIAGFTVMLVSTFRRQADLKWSRWLTLLSFVPLANLVMYFIYIIKPGILYAETNKQLDADFASGDKA
jgi:uncharacterized membrane protein YhaH (DUF805 family)